jgi:hypothetical protein
VFVNPVDEYAAYVPKSMLIEHILERISADEQHILVFCVEF